MHAAGCPTRVEKWTCGGELPSSGRAILRTGTGRTKHARRVSARAHLGHTFVRLVIADARTRFAYRIYSGSHIGLARTFGNNTAGSPKPPPPSWSVGHRRRVNAHESGPRCSRARARGSTMAFLVRRVGKGCFPTRQLRRQEPGPGGAVKFFLTARLHLHFEQLRVSISQLLQLLRRAVRKPQKSSQLPLRFEKA